VGYVRDPTGRQRCGGNLARLRIDALLPKLLVMSAGGETNGRLEQRGEQGSPLKMVAGSVVGHDIYKCTTG
jgi:hypothetical protein